MSTRKISFKLLTQQQLEIVETSARTFGELKAEISNDQTLKSKMSNFTNVQFIEKRTKVEYGKLDDAILPATDCIMFVQPLQTKSGSTYTDLQYNALRTFASTLNKNEGAGISLAGSRKDIIARLDEYYSAGGSSEATDTTSLVDQLKDAVEAINTCIDVLENAEEIEVEIPVNYIVSITEEDLDAEAKAINAQLNKK